MAGADRAFGLGPPGPPAGATGRRHPMTRTLRIFAAVFAGLVGLAVVAATATFLLFRHYGAGLPDYRQLANYDPPTVTRVHAGDGRLLAEYAIENRVFVPIEAIPKLVIDAFLSAEDKTFYSHPGIDIAGLVKALVTNVSNLGSARRPVGASTITQQVAKNFLLTNEVSVERKVKEAILAFRIEQAFSKDRILELYLNQIYLGGGSYGVAAAALNHFDKSMDELTIGEAAYLAALPKAPNNYAIDRYPEAAKSRRDWVVGRMVEDGMITVEMGEAAKAEPLVARVRTHAEAVIAPYFTEEVRRELAARYGDDQLYKGGLSVRTTLDPRLQRIAERVLRQGLVAYDLRHGWRGPIGHLEPGEDWAVRLGAVAVPVGLEDWRLAMVLAVDAAGAKIGFADGGTGRIPFAEMKWARPALAEQKVGAEPKSARQVTKPGDLVVVETMQAEGSTEPEAQGSTEPQASLFALRQIPEVRGGLVALDPHTGRVLAMVGGWSYEESEFNRATQALRQPGSAFKPFVYLAALDNGFTPATLVLDAPFVIDQGPDKPKWKPSNYTDDFLGPATLRTGLEKSRNLMTVRLAQAVGMNKVATVAEKFGVFDRMSRVLAMSLGAGETTLLRLTAAYAMLANGGKRIQPTLIDRTQDKHGKTLFRHDQRECRTCRPEAWAPGVALPNLPDTRERIADPRTVFQIVHMLQGVVERGTGTRVREVGKPIAGKTGTSNESYDTWFIGFSPDLAAGVFVGFDQPQTLGEKETGSTVAAPIFRDFMKEALEGRPATPFRIPSGIKLMRIDPKTGMRAEGGAKAILEAFKPGTEPVPGVAPDVVIGRSASPDQPGPAVTSSGGGSGTGTGAGTGVVAQPGAAAGSGGGATGGLY